MQIETYSGKVVSTEVIKSHTDFQDAAITKTVDLLTLTTNCSIISIIVDNSILFGGISKNHCFLSINNDMISNKNISVPLSTPNPYKNLLANSVLVTSDLSPFVIQATVMSEGNGGWSFSGNFNSINAYAQSGFGVQTAAACFGGFNISLVYITTTEEYNGILWASGGALNTGRSHLAGCGTLTAGLSISGWVTSAVVATCEEYNGTSWSSGGNINTSRHNTGAAGTQIAGLAFGGYTTSTRIKSTEEYNGTSWSTGGDLNVEVDSHGGCGTQTDALSFGGVYLTITEEYNGTSWATANNTIIGRHMGEGCGTSTSALSFNGQTASGLALETELYNGTSWHIGNNSNIGRYAFAGVGTQSQAALFGGQDVLSVVNCSITENWDKASPENLSNLNSGSLSFKIKYINYNV